ncbi:MAG: putative N-acetylmannosamine-6-phosphate 2-epimerase [Fimbriimonadaceae bacterium]
MTIHDLLNALRTCPIVASVQGSPGSPMDKPELLFPMAEASKAEGATILRLEGVAAINYIRPKLGLPVMGLLKRQYEDSEVYVTATAREVQELIDTGAEMIALDATRRKRPNDEQLSDLIKMIKTAGRLAMADCDSVASIHYAMSCGADFVSTTLSGYTRETRMTKGPDLDFVREAVHECDLPVLAEGRFTSPSQAQAALRSGASGVVIGGALNDPIKQTRAFVSAVMRPGGLVGAVDIGGTWIRFGVFDSTGQLLTSEREPLPQTRAAREDWILERVEASGVCRLGISTGGVVDPTTQIVIEAKEIIPDHVGSRFTAEVFGVPTVALNDGLASAWGHACYPSFAGKRVATLALGTGVGCGFVADMKILIGPNGNYPRLNDLGALPGQTFEDLLGGAHIANPTTQDRDKAKLASVRALRTIFAMWMPEVTVLCGGVGLSDWLGIEESGVVVRSPYGEDAGLFGAAWLAIMPPQST